MEQILDNRSLKKPKFGAFQTMGLSKELLRGVLARGYKTPTPIQRKMIPVAIDGKDIVATARTGSGKTGAFLIPIFQHLKVHSDNGARALIILPTRDLAIQTLRFTKDIGKFCDLKYALIVGGDSINSHFEAIHQKPDIIIATPGRILHVLVEMSMKLETLEVVVFDEADRLFELGFTEQLYEILKLIPKHKQSLLVSATLPLSVIQFTKVGLVNPELIRLDIDLKFSPNLKMNFIHCKTHEYKLGTLLHLLVEMINHEHEKTLVFTATKYHVEYLKEILDHTHIRCSVSYSSMDNEARKIHLHQFRAGETSVMIVTDIAARGLDIPHLDNVINFDFPKSPKLYVHRVGRVARMDKAGAAYSLFLPKELPYHVDLHTFMARDIVLAEEPKCSDSTQSSLSPPAISIIDGITGSVPPSVISTESTYVSNLVKSYPEILALKRKALLSEAKVKKFNKEASKQAVEYAKAIDLLKLNYHPLFEITTSDMVSHQILHVGHARSTANVGNELEKVLDASEKIKVIAEKTRQMFKLTSVSKKTALTRSRTNRHNILSKLLEDLPIKNKSSKFVDTNFEKAIEVNKNDPKTLDFKSDFETHANQFSFDIHADDNEKEKSIEAPSRKWDAQKKRYIRRNDGGGGGGRSKITNEHGVSVEKSFKSHNYKRWLNTNGGGGNTTTPNDTYRSADNRNESNSNWNNSTIATPRQILKKRLKRIEIKKKASKKTPIKRRKRR